MGSEVGDEDVGLAVGLPVGTEVVGKGEGTPVGMPVGALGLANIPTLANSLLPFILSPNTVFVLSR